MQHRHSEDTCLSVSLCLSASLCLSVSLRLTVSHCALAPLRSRWFALFHAPFTQGSTGAQRRVTRGKNPEAPRVSGRKIRQNWNRFQISGLRVLRGVVALVQMLHWSAAS